MTWGERIKGFLKPEKRQIIITILLFIWSFFSLMTGFGNGTSGPGNIFIVMIVGVGFILSFPAFFIGIFLTRLVEPLGSLGEDLGSFLLFLPLIFYCYFISCSLVWLYEKS